MSIALAVLAALALLGALVADYASRSLFDADGFADRATAALEDEALQTEVAGRVTDDLVLSAEADLIGARPLIEGAVSDVVGGGAFQSLFRAGVSDLHRAVFDRDLETLTLTLADVRTTIAGALEALRPSLARRLPGGEVEVLESDPPAAFVEVAQLADEIEALELILLGAALLLAIAAGALSRDRRETVLVFGVALASVAALGLVAMGLGRSLALAAVHEPGARDAAGAIWDAFLGDLRTALFLLAAFGAVTAAAASSVLRPVEVTQPLRRVWSVVATPPSSRGLRALRGVGLLLAGIVIVIAHDAVIELAVILAGIYVAYAGAAELMRLTVPEPGAGPARATGGRTRRTIAVAAGLTIAIAAAAVVLLDPEDDGATEQVPTPRSGCNGARALCTRTLDQVTLPATHNAMSGATYPDWLFAQQETGIADQLADGIRGLLIDTHYGIETEGGRVKTDLSDRDDAERRELERALGPEALEAALRIRDRIVDSPEVGERGVYLCHGFCEVGAITLDEALGEIVDFLERNPNEVLVIVNEDYASAADFAAAVESSGLIDYVYEGEPGPPWPTLAEMIAGGGRVLVMAENDSGGGGFPWYQRAYDLTQETPFTFKRPRELTDHDAIEASCEPNRGPTDASLFLVNHWIDTSPAPRPSNAAKVNARDPLLRRVQRCERIRGLDANLIAVDFYREGNVLDVVEALNERPLGR
ncbi:MAG: hypothetical protein ACRDK9_01780 [Solirubrobacterales bacterium]